MSVNLAPGPFGVGGQFFSGNTPLNGGLVYTLAAGTTTPQPTFTTSTGSTQNTNPITLSANGIMPQEMWLTAGIAYKIIVTDSVGTVIYPYTMDNLSGINDFSSIPTGSEWIASGLTPTFVSTSSFTVPGDQTVTGSGFFTANRRLFVMETAGTIYGVVTSASVTSSITTVNVAMDGGAVIDSGITAVSYGLLDSVNPSIPQYLVAGSGISIVYASGIPTVTNSRAIIVPRDYIAGCIMSTAGASGTMSIAAGQAVDSTNTVAIPVVAIAKTTAIFAAGTGNGGLDTGSIGNNTWYHFYAISNALGTLVDIVFSLNATSPALPTGYTVFRRIGSGITDGSAHWVAFGQIGNRFRYVTPILTVTSTSFTTYVSQVVNTPTGIQCLAFGKVNSGSANSLVQIRPVGSSDGTASFTATPLGYGATGVNGLYWQEYTDTSAQISIGGNTTTGSYLTTEGWFDNRGNNN